MTAKQQSSDEPVESEKAAAKPTALPTVVVGVRQLILALSDLVLASSDPAHMPGLRARVLAFRSMVLSDRSDNKWAKAIRKDRQLDLPATEKEPG